MVRYNRRMADFIKVATVADIPNGSMKTVRAQGKPIAIANVDGQFFAVGDTCTHEQCSLGTEGFLDGNIITCGCHGAQYDATSGKVLALPAPHDVASYRVKVEGADIFIQV